MTISELNTEISRLEMELAQTRARLKTLYGVDYRKTEIRIIKIKMDLDKAKHFLEIKQYGALANG